MKDTVNIINYNGLVVAILVIAGVEEIYINGEDYSLVPWDYDLIEDINGKCADVVKTANIEPMRMPVDSTHRPTVNFFKVNKKKGRTKGRVANLSNPHATKKFTRRTAVVKWSKTKHTLKVVPNNAW